MNNSRISGKARWIVLGLLLLLAVFFFAGKLMLENRAVQRVKEDLALAEPYLILENARVEASLLGRSVTLSDIVYSVPDFPELSVKIASLTAKGMDFATLLGRPGEMSDLDALILEKLEFYLKEAEKPVLEIEYYGLYDIAYNYKGLKAALQESKGSRDARARLAALIPHIKNSRLGAESLRNLKINLSQLNLFDFALGAYTTSGQTPLNPESNAGFDTGVDNVRLRDLSLSSGAPVKFSIGLEDFQMLGIKLHYGEIMDVLHKYSMEPSKPEDLLTALLPVVLDYTFERSESKNLRGSINVGEEISFLLDSVEAGPYNLREQGMERLRNLRVEINRKEVFSLEEAGKDKAVLPKTLIDLISNPKAMFEDRATQKKLSEQPYDFFKGLKLENIYLKNMQLHLPFNVSLGLWRTDIDLSDKANFKSLLRDLFLSQQALQQLNYLLYREAGELGEVLSMLGERENGLTLNSDFNLDMLIERILEFTLTFALEESSLGEFKFALDALSGPPSPYETYGDPLLRKLELSLADKGFLEAFFRYLANSGEYASPEEARADLLAGIEEAEKLFVGENPGIVNLAPALRSFVLEGGSLHFAVNAENPVLMDDLEEILLENPGQLTVTVQHSR
jgi:hypothetical protein